MKRALLGICCVVVMLFAQAAFASLPGGPANDDFANAANIASVPFTTTVDTWLATAEVGEPLPNCTLGTNTVWYSFTPSIDEGILIGVPYNGQPYQPGADYSVYSGSSLQDLTPVACGTGQVIADLLASRTYFIQVSRFIWAPGSITFSIQATGSLSGRFLDTDGNPPNWCDGYVSQAHDQLQTGGGYGFGIQPGYDGRYRLAYVPEGDYKMYYNCYWQDGSFDSGYYNGTQDYELAEVIPVAAGNETSGIDITHTVSPPPPPPTRILTDLAVSDLSVTPVGIQTDYGNAGYTGWLRDVSVKVANLSSSNTPGAFLNVMACPETTGDCQQIASDYVDLAAGASDTRTYRWNGLGAVGDMRLSASITPSSCYDDTAWSNNYREVRHYVLVAGTGFGATAPTFFRTRGSLYLVSHCIVVAPVPSPAPSPTP